MNDDRDEEYVRKVNEMRCYIPDINKYIETWTKKSSAEKDKEIEKKLRKVTIIHKILTFQESVQINVLEKIEESLARYKNTNRADKTKPIIFSTKEVINLVDEESDDDVQFVNISKLPKLKSNEFKKNTSGKSPNCTTVRQLATNNNEVTDPKLEKPGKIVSEDQNIKIKKKNVGDSNNRDGNHMEGNNSSELSLYSTDNEAQEIKNKFLEIFDELYNNDLTESGKSIPYRDTLSEENVKRISSNKLESKDNKNLSKLETSERIRNSNKKVEKNDTTNIAMCSKRVYLNKKKAKNYVDNSVPESLEILKKSDSDKKSSDKKTSDEIEKQSCGEKSSELNNDFCVDIEIELSTEDCDALRLKKRGKETMSTITNLSDKSDDLRVCSKRNIDPELRQLEKRKKALLESLKKQHKFKGKRKKRSDVSRSMDNENFLRLLDDEIENRSHNGESFETIIIHESSSDEEMDKIITKTQNSHQEVIEKKIENESTEETSPLTFQTPSPRTNTPPRIVSPDHLREVVESNLPSLTTINNTKQTPSSLRRKSHLPQNKPMENQVTSTSVVMKNTSNEKLNSKEHVDHDVNCIDVNKEMELEKKELSELHAIRHELENSYGITLPLSLIETTLGFKIPDIVEKDQDGHKLQQKPISVDESEIPAKLNNNSVSLSAKRSDYNELRNILDSVARHQTQMQIMPNRNTQNNYPSTSSSTYYSVGQNITVNMKKPARISPNDPRIQNRLRVLFDKMHPKSPQKSQKHEIPPPPTGPPLRPDQLPLQSCTNELPAVPLNDRPKSTNPNCVRSIDDYTQIRAAALARKSASEMEKKKNKIVEKPNSELTSSNASSNEIVKSLVDREMDTHTIESVSSENSEKKIVSKPTHAGKRKLSISKENSATNENINEDAETSDEEIIEHISKRRKIPIFLTDDSSSDSSNTQDDRSNSTNYLQETMEYKTNEKEEDWKLEVAKCSKEIRDDGNENSKNAEKLDDNKQNSTNVALTLLTKFVGQEKVKMIEDILNDKKPENNNQDKREIMESSQSKQKSKKTNSRHKVNELEKLQQDLRDSFIGDQVLTLTGRRNSSMIAEKKTKHYLTIKKTLSDDDGEHTNDLNDHKTKKAKGNDQKSENLANMIRLMQPIVRIKRLKLFDNVIRHPIETETLESLPSNEPLLEVYKEIPAPSQPYSCSTQSDKCRNNIIIKNINPEWHIRSKYKNVCFLCTEKSTKMVSHYVNKHDDYEVLISRLQQSDIENLRNNNYTATQINTELNNIQYAMKCMFCEQDLQSTFVKFNEHFSEHTGEYAFKCSKCEVRRSNKYQMQQHCKNECGAGAKIALNYSFDKNATVINAFICAKCNYFQLHKANVEKHLKIEHCEAMSYESDILKLVLIRKPQNSDKNVITEHQGNDKILNDACEGLSNESIEVDVIEDTENEIIKIENEIVIDFVDENFHETVENSKKSTNNNIFTIIPRDSFALLPNVNYIISESENNKNENGEITPEISVLVNANENPSVQVKDKESERRTSKKADKKTDVQVLETLTECDILNYGSNQIEAENDDSEVLVFMEFVDTTVSSKEDEYSKTKILEISNIGYKTTSEGAKYYCLLENCSFTVTTQLEALEEHVKSKHSNVLWDGMCKVCDNKLKKNNEMPLSEEIYHMVKDHFNEISHSQLRAQANRYLCNQHTKILLKPWLDSSKSAKTKLVCEKMISSSLCSLYKCMGDDCAFAVDSMNCFINHLNRHENSAEIVSYLECSYCNMISSTPSSLGDHILKEHGTSVFQCSQCFYRSIVAFNVKIHLEIHHQNVEDPKIFVWNDPIKISCEERYLLQSMSMNVSSFKCPECDQTFYVKKFLYHHMRQVHNIMALSVYSEIGIYACIYCSHNAHLMNDIRQHLSNCHPTKPLYVCGRFSNKKSFLAGLDYMSSIKSTSLIFVGGLVKKDLFKKYSCPAGQLQLPKISLTQPDIDRSITVNESLVTTNADTLLSGSLSPDISKEFHHNLIHYDSIKNHLNLEKLDDNEQIVRLNNLLETASNRYSYESNLYCCAKCNKAFNTLLEWKAHVVNSHAGSLNDATSNFNPQIQHKYFCYICGETTFNLKSSEEHALLKHNYVSIHLVALTFKEYCDGNVKSSEYFVVHKNNINLEQSQIIRNMLKILEQRYAIESIEKVQNEILPSAKSKYEELERTLPVFVPHAQRYLCSYESCKFHGHEKSLLEKHIKMVHSSFSSYKCPHCNMQIRANTARFYEVRNHWLLHSSSLVVCLTCKSYFTSSYNTQKHISKMHPSQDVTVIQYRRNETSVTKLIGMYLIPGNKSYHIQMYKYECLLCSVQFNSYTLIENHMKYSHETVVHYQCAYCEYSDNDEMTISDHLIKSHNKSVPRILVEFKKKVNNSIKNYTEICVLPAKTNKESSIIIVDDDPGIEEILPRNDTNTKTSSSSGNGNCLNQSNNVENQNRQIEFNNKQLQSLGLKQNLSKCTLCKFETDSREALTEHIKYNHEKSDVTLTLNEPSVKEVDKRSKEVSSLKHGSVRLKCEISKCQFTCDNADDLMEHRLINHTQSLPKSSTNCTNVSSVVQQTNSLPSSQNQNRIGAIRVVPITKLLPQALSVNQVECHATENLSVTLNANQANLFQLVTNGVNRNATPSTSAPNVVHRLPIASTSSSTTNQSYCFSRNQANIQKMIYCCYYCKFSSEVLQQLRVHWLEDHSSKLQFQYIPERQLLCGYCDVVGTFENLKNHSIQSHTRLTFCTRNIHPSISKKCTECNAETDNLVSHFENYHKNLILQKKSSLNYIDNNLLNDLLKTKYTKLLYKCNYCSSSFNDIQSCEEHIETDHPQKKILYKPNVQKKTLYSCEQCKQMLCEEEYSAIKHIREHTVQFVCSRCDSSFSHFIQLNEHSVAAHLITSGEFRRPNVNQTLSNLETYLGMLILFPNGVVLTKRDLVHTRLGQFSLFQKTISNIEEREYKCLRTYT